MIEGGKSLSHFDAQKITGCRHGKKETDQQEEI